MARIAILGSGGREHAMGWALARSAYCHSLCFLPGNGGTTQLGTNHPVDVYDFEAIASLLRSESIDMLVGGSEGPLVRGIKEYLHAQKDLGSLYVVGPGRSGARLEGSKAFAKAFMKRHGIPTAKWKAFEQNDVQAAVAYVAQQPLPHVLKADGLAAGKGVFISHELNESKRIIHALLQKQTLGTASSPLLIEEHMKGVELSCFILTDGQHYVYLPEVKDYKRRYEGEKGPNTGGMGAVSPVPFVDEVLRKRIQKDIIQPTLKGLQNERIPYSGFLFIGLMVVQGVPYVLEYNVRLGDPEAQALLTRIGDLGALLGALRDNRLHTCSLEVDALVTVALTLANQGYPGAYAKGHLIPNPKPLKPTQICFHAGTEVRHSKYHSCGGRVLSLVSRAATLKEAIQDNYEWAKRIQWPECVYRTDIGADLQKAALRGG